MFEDDSFVVPYYLVEVNHLLEMFYACSVLSSLYFWNQSLFVGFICLLCILLILVKNNHLFLTFLKQGHLSENHKKLEVRRALLSVRLKLKLFNVMDLFCIIKFLRFPWFKLFWKVFWKMKLECFARWILTMHNIKFVRFRDLINSCKYHIHCIKLFVVRLIDNIWIRVESLFFQAWE